MTPEQLALLERQLAWMRACMAHMQMCLEVLQYAVFADRLPGEQPLQPEVTEPELERVVQLARAVH